MIKLDRNLVGAEADLGTFTVSAEDIREFAEAVGDLNPLYIDARAARAAGYPDVIAPPTFSMKLRGGRMQPEVPLPPGLVGLHAGQEVELYDEICAGRTYAVRARITSIYEKTGRMGPMGIIARELIVEDEEGKRVVVVREREIVRSPEKRL
jgi:acyl dehydratase